MVHVFEGVNIGSVFFTRVILACLFFVSIVFMIVFSRMLKCPKCKEAQLKEEKKVRREPIRFVCSLCNIRWEMDRIHTQKPSDHKK